MYAMLYVVVFVCVRAFSVLCVHVSKLCVLCFDVLCDAVWFEAFFVCVSVFECFVSAVLCDVVWCVVSFVTYCAVPVVLFVDALVCVYLCLRMRVCFVCGVFCDVVWIVFVVWRAFCRVVCACE